MENDLQVILIPTICWSRREGRGACSVLCSILRNIVIPNYVKQDKQQRHLVLCLIILCCLHLLLQVHCYKKRVNKQINMDAAAP